MYRQPTTTTTKLVLILLSVVVVSIMADPYVEFETLDLKIC